MTCEPFAQFCNIYSCQLNASSLPQFLWPSLYNKLEKQVFDAGDNFQMLQIERETSMPESVGKLEWKVVATREVSSADVNSVFLIDHAWTFRYEEARSHLQQVTGLLERISSLMNIPLSDLSKEGATEQVLANLFSFSQTYSIRSPDESVDKNISLWYVMDEFGSRIGHCNYPSVRVFPFFYSHLGMSFSVMFPLHDLDVDDEVTRDYAEVSPYHKAEWKDLYLLPWIQKDYSEQPFEFLCADDTFFMESRENERIPSQDCFNAVVRPLLDNGKVWKIFTEYEKLSQNLTHPKLIVVDQKESADFWFLRKHYKSFDILAKEFPHVLINQFAFESVLTVKDLFAAAVHSFYFACGIDKETLEPFPPWFQTCFNLVTELPQFVSYFQNRQKRGFDNHWIVKPWNLARSMDMYVTSNLNSVIRLIDSGSKIACKYIEEPVLFSREEIGSVKFDMRFIVFVTGLQPLKAYLYNNFWLRFANKPFSLDNVDDYEKHFTVMNYVDPLKIKQMFCHDFISEFCRQYPSLQWSDVYKSCCTAMKEALKCVSANPPPRGLAPNPQCRAMYGVDLMLKWCLDENGSKIVQPVILEFNFMPDCERACNYYPDFMNTVCQVLYLDEIEGCPVTRL